MSRYRRGSDIPKAAVSPDSKRRCPSPPFLTAPGRGFGTCAPIVAATPVTPLVLDCDGEDGGIGLPPPPGGPRPVRAAVFPPPPPTAPRAPSKRRQQRIHTFDKAPSSDDDGASGPFGAFGFDDDGDDAPARSTFARTFDDAPPPTPTLTPQSPFGAEDGDARIRLEHSPASPESLALDARPRRLPSLSLPRPLLRASSSAETFPGGYEEAKEA